MAEIPKPHLDKEQPGNTEAELSPEELAQYSVTPEEAQAWLMHLGYGPRDWKTYADMANNPDDFFDLNPEGSHELRAAARIAMGSSPRLLEEVDREEDMKSLGTDVMREETEALKKWFEEQKAKYPEIDTKAITGHITREQVVDRLRSISQLPQSELWYGGSLEVDNALKYQDLWEIQQENSEDTSYGSDPAYAFEERTLWFDAGFEVNEASAEHLISSLKRIKERADSENNFELSQAIDGKIEEIASSSKT